MVVVDQKGVESLDNFKSHFTCLNTMTCFFSFYSRQGQVTHSLFKTSSHFALICPSANSNAYFRNTRKIPRTVHWLISCPNGTVMKHNLWLIDININYSIVEWLSYLVSWIFLGCSFSYTRNPILLQFGPPQTIEQRRHLSFRFISASVLTFLSRWLNRTGKAARSGGHHPLNFSSLFMGFRNGLF